MNILAGDIGGTKTMLAVFERSRDGLRKVCGEAYRSGDYESLEDILDLFLKQFPRLAPSAAAFGVAGPVSKGKSKITNLPWHLEERLLAQRLKLESGKVLLLNDVFSAAFAMPYLPSEAFVEIHAGDPPDEPANIAVLSVGTGLGESILFWDGQRYEPVPSEGGHKDFAPSSEREIELLRYLWKKFGDHVSYERILSGAGIHDIYLFLRESGFEPEPEWLRRKLAQGDPNAAITEVGIERGHPLCTAALEIFCSVLAGEAGNLALQCVALSGVILGGGIPPKLLPVLKDDCFRAAFTRKGRFSQLVAGIPVRVALETQAPLIGAAHFIDTRFFSEGTAS